MKNSVFIVLFLCYHLLGFSQELPHKIKAYEFTIKKQLDATSVKNQNKSGTCWIYSTNSFLESEMSRMGKKPIDLSEMYISRCGYLDRADNYVRRQGNAAFAQGGENGDVMRLIKKYGIYPQSIYSGFPEGQDKPWHSEMESVLRGILDNMIKVPDGKLSPNWRKVFTAALDAYFGVPPANFMFEGKSYTPQSFSASIGINPDDYIAITSFTHHEFYKPFILEVADNWANGDFYNVPIDDLIRTTDNALDQGYTVLWATDVSEKTFSRPYGIAINPYMAWEDMDEAERDSLWTKPRPEKLVTQEERQVGFDNLSTTDDHGMHIIGKAVDQNGTPYYIVKNSWGTANKITNGYLYASAAYFRNKTISVMVHKNAIPKDIRSKLNL